MVDTKHRTCSHPGCTRLPSKSAAAPAAAVAVAAILPPSPSPLSPAIAGNHRPLPAADSQAPSRVGPFDGHTPTPPVPAAASAAAELGTARTATTTATGAAKYCAEHAPAGAVNVTAGRCQHPGGCSVQPYFGREGLGQPAEFCARHRKKGMTDVRNPRCADL